MRTTVRLGDSLLTKAKQEARSARVRLPVSKARGGVRPGIDLDDTSALLDHLDEIR